MSEAEERRPRAGRRAAVLGAGQRAYGWGGRTADAVGEARAWLAAALHEEADSGRLAPWLAVAFGTGVLLYFAAPSEPLLAAPLVAASVLGFVAWASRERTLAFPVVLGLLAIVAGFSAGCLRGALVAHKPLSFERTVTVRGYVEERDATERSDRVVLRVTGVAGRNAKDIPERVRIAFRRGTAPAVGTHVETLARLSPPIGPVRPGGYDYARGIYFQGIGATGFSYGKSKAVTAEPPPVSIRVRAAVETMRRSLTDRIRAIVPGETGAIAAALVTGVRDEISADSNEAMRVSGLYHLLSISGLHMALIAGVLFALIRGGLALIPSLALRRPIKKWAAVTALAGCAFYLVLSGAEVATQRSFIMIAIVLGGVLVDRPALTVRTLSVAAIVVLALQPEALLNPSFQMSFAATLALVALYERYMPLLVVPPVPGSGGFAHFSERTLRWLLLGAATSLFAGLATAAYVAFHFQRVAPYSVVANLLAMPLISFVIMPAGLLAVLLMPFGYDTLGWKVMGAGIDGVLKIAQWVATLPSADGRFAAFGAGALLLASAGILLLALPVSKLRFAGVPVLALAFVLAVAAPRPDVLIDASGEVIAVRGADGRLQILGVSGNRFVAESWLAADADLRRAGKALEAGFACDARACTAKLADGTKIAVARQREAFAEDCHGAALVISRFGSNKGCAGSSVDRATLRSTGALALWRKDGGWIAESARALDADRPWYGRRSPANANALASLKGRAAATRADAATEPVRAEGETAPPDVIAPGDE
jgi:competence protein ComEC